MELSPCSFFPGNQLLFSPRRHRPRSPWRQCGEASAPSCELHAHTRWSDGDLSIAELVDVHGRSGFDALCITDHVVRSDDSWREEEGLRCNSVKEGTFPQYLAEIEREAVRAWRTVPRRPRG